ncbi:MAG: hypothetical protein J5I65_00195 [Aridibacter famidurans]|nr:hypothetical protein [Aridibacter famidurans]
MRFLIAFLAAAAFLPFAAVEVPGQQIWESVPFRGLPSPEPFFCAPSDNSVVSSAELEKLWSHERCAEFEQPNADLSKESLLAYRAGGDCHMRLLIDVLVDRAARKYLVEIVNIWGGCRAGGRRAGWLVIDKVPDDFSVEFREIHIGEREFSKDPEVLKIKSKKNRKKLSGAPGK